MYCTMTNFGRDAVTLNMTRLLPGKPYAVDYPTFRHGVRKYPQMLLAVSSDGRVLHRGKDVPVVAAQAAPVPEAVLPPDPVGELAAESAAPPADPVAALAPESTASILDAPAVPTPEPVAPPEPEPTTVTVSSAATAEVPVTIVVDADTADMFGLPAETPAAPAVVPLVDRVRAAAPKLTEAQVQEVLGLLDVGAGAEDLLAVQGVGKATAQRIVAAAKG